MFTETWLHDDISSEELNLPNFNIFRFDRKPTTSQFERGGGVMVAIHRKYSSIEVTPLHTSLEQLYILVKLGSSNVIINAVYIPPNSSIDTYVSYTEQLEHLFELNPTSELFIVGDFNLPHVIWKNVNCEIKCEFENATNEEIEIASLMSNSMNYLNLFQTNNIPNTKNRTLDLIFVHDENCKTKKADCTFVPIDSYHPALDIIFSLKDDFTSLKFLDVKYRFENADYEKINHEIISLNWFHYFEQHSLELSLSYFYEKIYEIIENYVPKQIIYSDTYPPWYSKELKKITQR